MLDFLSMTTKMNKQGTLEVFPSFKVIRSKDLMIRGNSFYAIWDEVNQQWSTDEFDAVRLIDEETLKYVEEKYKDNATPLLLVNADNCLIDKWNKFCQKQTINNYKALDETLIFDNMEKKRENYSSKSLPYALESGDYDAWDRLISVLYSEEERHKIEWAIGSIVSGDSRFIQKFMVLYGSAGTGKSTILNIIQKLFDGYYTVFDAKTLGNNSNAFALEAFRSNPLVAIQHDGDLSKIEDNTKINSLVSHEEMTINEKFKSTYTNSFKAFLFMGTNKPVRITDAKSGLIRRLIDVKPTGDKIPAQEYMELTKKIDYQLGGIASHCLDVYLEDPNYYDAYVPVDMLGASNDFYNFIADNFATFSDAKDMSLTIAWEMYKNYCEDSKNAYPLTKRAFREELKNYFEDFKDRYFTPDGERHRSYYIGFLEDKFDSVEGSWNKKKPASKQDNLPDFLNMIEQDSIFDEYCKDRPAQYTSQYETPIMPWDKVTTTLSDINTRELHYVDIPVNHIVIDFDIPDKNGNKNLEANLKAASQFPKTYAELSKSGQGIHLHYIYKGDATKLSRIYDEHIEVKVYVPGASLRRKLTKCNNVPISEISSGLPLKEVNKKVISNNVIKNEKMLRIMILKNLNKEYHSATKPSMDFIHHILEDAYNNGLHYDVTDLRPSIMSFAASSTHQSAYCLKLMNDMKFQSEDISDPVDSSQDSIVFFDIEIFPNLFLVNWKYQGEGKQVFRMINPSPKDIERLIQFKLVGFNNRRYDNHMLYARLLGYSIEDLYELSQRIVNGSPNAMFAEAYNLSYTDVYDFSSAVNKKSLKKWEIELGIKHHELGLPWDQPVDESLWTKVAEYCDDDVLATEAVFNYLQADFDTRKMLADIAGKTVNDSTNSLSTTIVFGSNRKPQNEFNYRDLSKPVQKKDLSEETYKYLEKNTEMPLDFTAWNGEKSVLPFFPGYTHSFGKSVYRDIEVGEGGYVFAEPGIHENVALLDVASMHPHSTIAECLFGPKYTKHYQDLVNGRIAIKHKDFDTIKTILNGKLAPYVTDDDGMLSILATALKTPINSSYGLTAASFENPFRDPRNVDNIVAKRGALFMVDLKYEVEKRGFTVAHIKTDSIKIPNATKEIIDFVMDFGKKYGYTFEHEATYKKMCLVNNAVYIAKYEDPNICKNMYGYIPGDNYKHGNEWTATGTQFAVPYVYKTLFSKEPITLADMSETKSVKTVMHLDFNENLGEDEHNLSFVGKVGAFTPVLPGTGGGILVREGKDKNDNIKYDSVTGTKGFRWVLSDTLKSEDQIDKSFYKNLVDDAVEAINKYGDAEAFME